MSKPLAEGERTGPAGDAPQVEHASADLPPPRLLLIPDDLTEFNDAGSAVAAPAPQPRRRDPRRAVRSAVYILAGAVAGAAAFYVATRAVHPRSGGARLEHPAVEAPPRASLSSLADTLALAVSSFELRTALFGSHQMQCSDLARGLVLLEERWAAYNSTRRGERVTLDSSQDAADRSLYSRVDQAERRFEQSACPRP